MFTETFHFEPLPNGGTRLRDIMQMHLPLPRFVRRVLVRMLIVHQYKYDQLLHKAAQLAAEEYDDNHI